MRRGNESHTRAEWGDSSDGAGWLGHASQADDENVELFINCLLFLSEKGKDLMSNSFSC